MPFDPEISYDLDKTDAHSVHVPFAARWRSAMKIGREEERGTEGRRLFRPGVSDSIEERDFEAR